MSFANPQPVEVEETHLRVTTVLIEPGEYLSMLVGAAMAKAGITGRYEYRNHVIRVEGTGRVIHVRTGEAGDHSVTFTEDLAPASRQDEAA